LSEAYATLAYWGVVEPEAALESSKIAGEKAVSLDNELSEAHAAYGWCAFLFEWDWPAAEREFKLAVDLDRNSLR
jgi:hypothetical protein